MSETPTPAQSSENNIPSWKEANRNTAILAVCLSFGIALIVLGSETVHWLRYANWSTQSLGYFFGIDVYHPDVYGYDRWRGITAIKEWFWRQNALGFFLFKLPVLIGAIYLAVLWLDEVRNRKA
jgi:hypothetical protein